jgi:hypothetical protein
MSSRWVAIKGRYVGDKGRRGVRMATVCLRDSKVREDMTIGAYFLFTKFQQVKIKSESGYYLEI